MHSADRKGRERLENEESETRDGACRGAVVREGRAKEARVRPEEGEGRGEESIAVGRLN